MKIAADEQSLVQASINRMVATIKGESDNDFNADRSLRIPEEPRDPAAGSELPADAALPRRMKRVAELRRQVESGAYRVSSHAVAEKMLAVMGKRWG